MKTGRTLSIGLLALALTALAAGGCGSSAAGGDGKHPDYATALAGSPPPLAALHAQANELLPGGTAAYEKRIAALAGYPIVVNAWASWCGPCRYEFSMLQDLSARFGKRVAFFGVDAEDDSEQAKRFLAEEQVPYPSYSDPDKEIYDLFDGYGFPNTAFYSREGELLYRKIGAYPDHEAFEADVRRYALESG